MNYYFFGLVPRGQTFFFFLKSSSMGTHMYPFVHESKLLTVLATQQPLAANPRCSIQGKDFTHPSPDISLTLVVVDRFCIALPSAFKQTHCARMRFYTHPSLDRGRSGVLWPPEAGRAGSGLLSIRVLGRRIPDMAAWPPLLMWTPSAAPRYWGWPSGLRRGGGAENWEFKITIISHLIWYC